MSKTSVSSAVETVAEPESKSKTITRWDTFDKAGLAVKSIECSVLPGHPADEACKTHFVPTGTNVINHMGHGGGFIFVVEPSGKPWPGWKELAKAGVEIQSMRDLVTDHEVNISVRAIRAVLQPHKGKFRGAYQAFKNKFLFNLQFTPPIGSSDDYDDDPSNE